MIPNSIYTTTNHPLFAEQHFHIYNHANGEHNIFFNGENRRYFLKKYDAYMYEYVETFAYCLMPNHFHIQVQIRSKAAILAAAKIDFPKGLPNRDKIHIADFEVVTELSDAQAAARREIQPFRVPGWVGSSSHPQETCRYWHIKI